MADDVRESALEYHRKPKPGKLGIHATKPLETQRDLALAYTPGVAAACEEIVRDPIEAYSVTARGNLVAVVTNGTAVLGLGAIGALASKPVMEGKAVLFKKFANIDVFDIEIDETDIDRFVEIVTSLEPTIGAINLEDVKAPECFEIERRLRERMNIPVFHDDQHGTAICVAAAVLNGLRVVDKDPSKARLAASGAGASAIACLELLVRLGMARENILVTDRSGVIYEGRGGVSPEKSRFAQTTNCRTLADALDGADIFLGLSGPGVVSASEIATMGPKPLILALANPTPEILPEEIRSVRDDAVIATGRSDYPNQVNNVLCFPFIFRGALDVGATEINTEMELACVRAIANLAMAESSEVVAAAYSGQSLDFGPDYILPKPFDPRLISHVAPEVAKAAMESGVATRPIADLVAYRGELEQFTHRTGYLMREVFDQAQSALKRVVYAEGEEERVLRAVQTVVDEGLARPILIGRPGPVAERIERLGLRLQPGRDIDILNPEDDPNYEAHCRDYHSLRERAGVSPALAADLMRTRATALAAVMVRRGEADAMLAGPIGRYQEHRQHIFDVIEVKKSIHAAAAMQVLVLDKGTFFLADTHVNDNPDAEHIAHIARLAAYQVRNFGIEPKIAMLSSSNFGSNNFPSTVKMREAVRLLRDLAPDLEVEGEMHGDLALDEALREAVFPGSNLSGQANLLIMPNLDAANIAFNLLKFLATGQSIGPILLGLEYPAHVLIDSVSVRGIVNMTAIAAADAQLRGGAEQLTFPLVDAGIS